MAIRTRAYRGEPDLQRVVDLLLRCRAAGQIDHWPPAIDLRLLLTTGAIDRAQDVRLWEEEDRSPVAFAVLWMGPYLVSCVHPDAQAQILEAQILTWGMERARAIGQAGVKPDTLSVAVRADQAERIVTLDQQGFQRKDWQTLRMICPLDVAFPAPQCPEGFTLRPLAGEQEAEAYVALHNAAFTESTMTVADRVALMRDPAYLADLDLVAVAPNGTLAGFCTCSIGAEENARLGRRDGWVDLIGTDPALRGKGLGRALLLTGLHRLQAHGMERAMLGTQSQNVSARQLYASVGFRIAYQVLWYARAL